MNRLVYIDIQFKGKGLNPTILASKIHLPIEALVTAGEIAKVGRYKGKLAEYGIGLLPIIPTINSIEEYVDLLINCKAILAQCKVEEIIFDVDASSNEFEQFSLTNDIINKLGLLNAKIQYHHHSHKKDDFHNVV